MPEPATPDDVAKWMLEQFEATGELSQHDAAEGIARRFGSPFVYENDSGNRAIDRKVLKAFRHLTETEAIWDKWDKCWRRRQASDPPGKRLVE